MGDFCVSGFHSHLPIHDNDMWEERLKMLKVYENIIMKKMKSE